MVILTGDRIYESFYKKTHSRFAGPKKGSRNSEATVYYWGVGRRGFTAAPILTIWNWGVQIEMPTGEKKTRFEVKVSAKTARRVEVSSFL